jgi:hypothetical protein
MYVCMCLCMHVYMYIITYVNDHFAAAVRPHSGVNLGATGVCMYVCMYACMYAYHYLCE